MDVSFVQLSFKGNGTAAPRGTAGGAAGGAGGAGGTGAGAAGGAMSGTHRISTSFAFGSACGWRRG